jgi:hypothetical protein
MSDNKVLPTTHVNAPMPTVSIPVSRELTPQELAGLQAYIDEIKRLSAINAKLRDAAEPAMRTLNAVRVNYCADWSGDNHYGFIASIANSGISLCLSHSSGSSLYAISLACSADWQRWSIHAKTAGPVHVSSCHCSAAG